jgi:hypothetical protein
VHWRLTSDNPVVVGGDIPLYLLHQQVPKKRPDSADPWLDCTKPYCFRDRDKTKDITTVPFHVRRWKYRSDKERIFTKFLAHADSDILKVRRQRVNRQYTRAPQQPSATPDPLASPLLSLSPSLNNMPCPTPMQKRRLVAFADGSTCGRISEKDKHEAQPGVLVGSAVRAILGLRSMDDSACHSDVPWS